MAPPTTQYDRSFRKRREFVQRQYERPLVVRFADRQFELSRQGRLLIYLHPNVFDDTCLDEWAVFMHDVRDVSGRHRHQGGLVLFIVEGEGYTVMEGERYDWKAGDLILMPLLPGGVEHQHFNPNPGQSVKWLAFINDFVFKHVSMEMTQTAENAEWTRSVGSSRGTS